MSTAKQILGLLFWLLITFAAAAIGNVATNTTVDGWYQQLARPSWAPPDWVFGPVWTTLYLMMAIGAWLIWRQGGFAAARWPLSLYFIQLALNSLWSVVFFAMQSPWLASGEIILLWLAIAATIAAFFKRSTIAAILLVPYLAWVTYAAALNVAIASLNR